MSNLTAAEFAKHKEMMSDPGKWPRWPLLPIKRSGSASPDGFPQTAIMCNIRERLTDVYFCNMFDLVSGPLGPQLDKCEKKTYTDYEAILDDGWVVD